MNDLGDFWKDISVKKISVNEHKVKCIIKCEGIEECENIKIISSSVSSPNFNNNSYNNINNSISDSSSMKSDIKFDRRINSRMTLHSIKDSTTTLTAEKNQSLEDSNTNQVVNSYHSDDQTSNSLHQRIHYLEINVI